MVIFRAPSAGDDKKKKQKSVCQQGRCLAYNGVPVLGVSHSKIYSLTHTRLKDFDSSHLIKKVKILSSEILNFTENKNWYNILLIKQVKHEYFDKQRHKSNETNHWDRPP